MTKNRVAASYAAWGGARRLNMNIYDIDPDLVMTQRESAQAAFDKARIGVPYGFFMYHDDGKIMSLNAMSGVILRAGPGALQERQAFLAAFVAIAREAMHPVEETPNAYGTEYRMRLVDGTQQAKRAVTPPAPRKDRHIRRRR